MPLKFKYGHIAGNSGVIVEADQVPDGDELFDFIGEMRRAIKLRNHPLLLSWDCYGGQQPVHIKTPKDFIQHCISLGIDV